jgi:hypothetical protein
VVLFFSPHPVLLNLSNGAIYIALKQITDFLSSVLGSLPRNSIEIHSGRRETGDCSLVNFRFTPLIIIPSTMATDPDPGLIPSTTRFSDAVGPEQGPLKPREYN